MNLLRIDDLVEEDLALLLDLAAESRHNPGVARRLLREEAVLLWFDHAAPFSRLAAAAAVARLGAAPVVAADGDLATDSPAAIRDSANAVGGSFRAVVAGLADDRLLHAFASASAVPVVSGGTDTHDPVAALAALAALRQKFGSLGGVRLAYVGAAGPAANSLVQAAALAGVDVTVATPPGFEAEADAFAAAEETGLRTGALVLATHDPYQGVAGAHAVCTGPWPADAADAGFEGFCVDEGLLRMADPDAVVCHFLPAVRGREVAADVLDGRRSLCFELSDNRGHVLGAALRALIGHRLAGSRRRAFARTA